MFPGLAIAKIRLTTFFYHSINLSFYWEKVKQLINKILSSIPFFGVDTTMIYKSTCFTSFSLQIKSVRKKEIKCKFENVSFTKIKKSFWQQMLVIKLVLIKTEENVTPN